MENKNYRAARDIAVVLLRAIPKPTHEDVREKAESGLKAVGSPSDVNLEELTADLLHSFSVFAGSATALDDPRGHHDWLPNKRGSIDWHFWHRYETYLEQTVGLPIAVVRGVGELTDEVLKRLEDPARPGKWVRHGMVVGSVQSGKTSNYTGLICKAVDAGYRIVIVLAGLHNNLRSQTQLRLDEGFLGFDTEKDRKLNQNNKFKGVGLLPSQSTLHVMSLTSSAENGDFKKAIANTIAATLGGVPTLLVVKKQGRILKNLREWLTHLAGSEVVRNVPLLLIDDEADQASINTKSRADLAPGQMENEEDVSTINRRIREILAAFEKCAYVGYTATPFANIFINPDAQHERFEDDIFPRSFILNVRPPGTYVGPARVFGLEADPDAGIEGRDPLPLVNHVNDFEQYFPPGHKKDHVPTGLPPSLIRAVHWFVLVCAARHARGQVAVHNSMLIHVTRFVAVQSRTTALVKAELDTMRKRITNGDGDRRDQIRNELQSLWKDEYSKREDELRRLAPDEVGRPLKWEEIDAALHDSTSKIEVMEINGSAKDALDYVNHPEGFSVIAVGGDKLSRGLTLEGLSVSYFLRTSKMYDTLMQMGRWFGYRVGYLDLCRLFTTFELSLWYRHIALAEEELRREFEYMASSGLTPEKYGLRVRSHSGGMIVTALNKMCHSQTQELSFAGELKQTAYFATDKSIRERNWSVVEKFLSGLGSATPLRQIGWLWDINADVLCRELIPKFAIHPQCHTIDAKRLIDFIQRQNAQGELTSWTIGLMNNSKTADRRPFANLDVGLTERTGTVTNGVFCTAKANIQSPSHQASDLSVMTLDEPMLEELLSKRNRSEEHLFSEEDEECLRRCLGMKMDAVAFELTKERAKADPDAKEPKEPHGRVIRELRPVSRGLLLIYLLKPTGDAEKALLNDEPPCIGLAFSFPSSHTAKSISYEVNKVLIEELKDDQFAD